MTLARVVHDRIQEQGGELVPLPAANSGLEAWARKAQVAFDIAKALALTPFVPESLIVKYVNDEGKSRIDVEATTGNVLGVLLAGDELGLQPMASLRSIDIIEGVPAMRAIAQRALVQSAGHELVVEISNKTECIVKGRRKGQREWSSSHWNLDRAKDLGLAGKRNWRTQPTAMLLARASSECARMTASDALLGMPYSIEELQDGADSIETPPAEEPAGSSRRGSTRQRRSAAKQSPASSSAQQGDDDETPEPDFGEPEDPSSEGSPDQPAAEDDDHAASDTAATSSDDSASPAATPSDEAAPPADSSGEQAGTADSDPPTDEAAPDPERATDAQLKLLHVCLGKCGLGQRDAGLKFINDSLKVEPVITTSKQLTKSRASTLIDMLERRIAAASQPAEPSFDEVPLPSEPPEE